MHYFSRSVSSLLIFKISLEPQYLYNRFLQTNFCENTFGHVLGNEVVHRVRFHHILSFCSSYNLSTSERDQGNFCCSCQSFVRSCESVTKDKRSQGNLQPNQRKLKSSSVFGLFASPCLLFFQDELQAKISLKAFSLQTIG